MLYLTLLQPSNISILQTKYFKTKSFSSYQPRVYSRLSSLKTPFALSFHVSQVRVVSGHPIKFTRGVDFSWQTQALLALKEAAEAFPVRLFQDARLLSLHAGRIMLSSKDAQLAC